MVTFLHTLDKPSLSTAFVIWMSLLLGAPSLIYGQEKSRNFPVPQTPFAPQEYVVYQTRDSITIDGKMDEASWQQAKWTDSFVKAASKGNVMPEYATKVKVLWDEDYLYVGAYLEDPHLWSTMHERDMPLHLANAFEIFIDPDKDTYNYIELQINALGTIWDLYLSRPYRDGGQGISDYNLLNYHSAVHLDGTINEPGPEDEGWSLEYAIPIPSILALDTDKQSLSDGDQWKVNFQRAQRRLEVTDGEYQLAQDPTTNKPYPPDYSVWSPQGIINIHYPEMWGLLQFSEATVGDDEVPFEADPGQPYKWLLRQLYYEMKEFQSYHGYFPNNIQALNIKDPLWAEYQDRIMVETTRSLFQITLMIKESETVWHINHLGRIWSN
ncbi:carbohydrate-binding family 9-like protein [Fodinibius salsisoli]|uniref:Carbohydrate-binding family 9-like protein n=1 Tax=Fodinibius salsisoli TaxID=2820877 RepID=A0ABT3PQ20_9BACT|nr:carbohydrate-binding family 9-like protein [Fodinibius salsisoli]MCW9707957.1 carbohydrate-binding family 9-like protein [Fodinibius salsisoli]